MRNSNDCRFGSTHTFHSTIEGYTRVRGGWNEGEAYTVYFYAETDTPAESFGTWKGNTLMPNTNEQFDSGEKQVLI